MVICDQTTWIPYFHVLAVNCHQLRLLYFQHGVEGAGGHGLGGRNCATIYYRRVVGGNICHVTNSSESSVGAARHSERVCHQEMIAREGGMPPVIECVYTERYPCGPANMNCLGFLNANMPNGTPVFWSFDWPDAVDIVKLGGPDKRKDPDDEAKRDAKRRRKEGTRDLKLYHRDLDYRGSVVAGGEVGSGGSVTVAGEVEMPAKTLLEGRDRFKKMPNPFPRSPVY
jgi:Xanthomonas XOO_2897-like deaminase